jgi:DNA-binding NarL/FixJ family response regulator
MKVLLADDSVLILERLQEMLSIYTQAEIVGKYMDGNDTLEALRLLKPDLAIVDINIPGLNGLEVIQKIKNEDQSIKFIILTFCSSYYKKLALQAGADYFFSKVDDFEKVSLVVKEMLKVENDKIM